MVLQALFCFEVCCAVLYLALAARLVISSLDFVQVFQSDLSHDSMFALKCS